MGVLFSTVFLVRLLQRPEETEEAAYRVLGAIEAGDSARYQVYRELRPILESLQLKGAWMDLRGRVLSWDEIEQRFRDRAAKAEAAG